VEGSLLATKIGVPPARPRLVSRNRLIDRLNDGSDYSLTLVSAPPGFGKTTMVSDWCRANGSRTPVTWLSLDEADDDPARFWDYVVAALRVVQPTVGETALSLLHSPQPAPIQSALVPLLNELAQASQDFVLVLDDYQFIKSQDIQSGVAFLLEHMPRRMRLLIVTRADPALPLARLRGRGRMMEIGADDLRFTLEETVELMRQLRATLLPLEDVRSLNQRTEGWAVGLKMAALSMGQREDVSGFIADFAGSQRYVMDYLIEEVLEQQPADLQDFLLKTSFLEKLTASLCDAVTGRTDSQELLPALERANLFLVPLDGSRQWFRYEHLFAELLRHRLTRVSGEAAAAELHERASRWYKDQGLLGDSIDHALAAQDWQAALDLLGEVSESRLLNGEMVTLAAWFRAVPEEVLLSRPRLCGDYSAALIFTGRLDAAEIILARVEPIVGTDTGMSARVVALRAIIASLRGDIEQSVELAQWSLPRLSPADVSLRASLSLNLGVVYWYLGFLRKADPLYEEAYRAAKQAGNPGISMVALSMLADIARWRGRLSRTIELCEEALESAPDSPFATNPHSAMIDPLYERNQLEAALSHANRALDLNRLQGHRPSQWSTLSNLAQIRLALGDKAGALRATQEVDQLLAGDPRPEARSHHAAHHALLSLRLGDVDEAACWGERLRHVEGPVGFWDRLLLIRLLAVQGQEEAVSEQIRHFYESVEVEPFSPEWQGWSIVLRISQALCTREPEDALGYLADALAAAEPEGWIRSFVDEGSRLVPLLRAAVSRGICADYAHRLLAIIEMEQGRDVDAARSAGRSSVPTLLTEREVEILRLVAAGLSNGQIAGGLFISTGTVKVHLHNISEKLSTTNRTGAAARARDLGLL
jgi:LuxR family transcriptional regulator, maltose regulon positive regulatory protein